MVRLLSVLALSAAALALLSAPFVHVSADQAPPASLSIHTKEGVEYWDKLVAANHALFVQGMEGYFTTHTQAGDKLEKFGGVMIRKVNPDRVKFVCPSTGQRLTMFRQETDFATLGIQCPEIRKTWIQELHQFGGKFPERDVAFTDGAVDADDEEQSPINKLKSHRNHKNCHHNKGTKVSVDVNVN